MTRCTIISPSGNFYGSEQVLFDFLTDTRQVYTVLVPSGSILLRRLREAGLPHRVKTFHPGALRRLYTGIFLRLGTGQIRTLYLNEAGHSKYAVLLARCYPKRKFVVHVRMNEDTDPARWPSRPLPNLHPIAISEFIQYKLPLPAVCIADPYRFTDRPMRGEKNDPSCLTIGIIGRITVTKGLNRLLQLVEYAGKDPRGSRLRFRLFGDVSGETGDRDLVSQLQDQPYVKIEGFVADKNAIYDSLDCVLHLSVVEALGRIFFEAIDYGKPFIGLNAAGIGEIGRLTGLDRGLIPPDEEWKDNMLQRLLLLDKNYDKWAAEVQIKKEACWDTFSMDRYVQQITDLIAP